MIVRRYRLTKRLRAELLYLVFLRRYEVLFECIPASTAIEGMVQHLGVSEKMARVALRWLEDDGLIQEIKTDNLIPEKKYQITEKGWQILKNLFLIKD